MIAGLAIGILIGVVVALVVGLLIARRQSPPPPVKRAVPQDRKRKR